MSFISTPDYENPTDQAADNSYSVTITASNTAGSADLSLSITVTDDSSDTAGTSGKMVRVNVRGTVSSGVGARIVSFKLAFDNNSTTDTSDVLVRGIGPGLSGDSSGNYNYATDYTPLSNPKLSMSKGLQRMEVEVTQEEPLR